MTVAQEFTIYVLEQLKGLGNVRSKRMFGGVGLWSDGAFFGLIASDVVYFKVGDSNRADFEARGMGRFRPHKRRPQMSMSYYEVPPDVLEDAEECVLWARRSVAIAHSSSRG